MAQLATILYCRHVMSAELGFNVEHKLHKTHLLKQRYDFVLLVIFRWGLDDDHSQPSSFYLSSESRKKMPFSPAMITASTSQAAFDRPNKSLSQRCPVNLWKIRYKPTDVQRCLAQKHVPPCVKVCWMACQGSCPR
jgi:hypothetical protein